MPELQGWYGHRTYAGLVLVKAEGQAVWRKDVGSFPRIILPSSLPPHRLAALSERETRLQEVRSVFLAAYSSTVGLQAAAPSPSGAIGGLLEQFVRGVGLRGMSSNTL